MEVQDFYYLGSIVFFILTVIQLIRIYKIYGLNFFVRPSVVMIFLLAIIYILPLIFYKNFLINITTKVTQVALITSVVIFITSIFIVWFENFIKKIKLKFLNSKKMETKVHLKHLIIFLIFVIIVVIILYFTVTSFCCTGLYGLICDPQNYTLLREASLKLLGNKWMQYLYLMTFTGLAPLLCALSVHRILINKKKSTTESIILNLSVFGIVIFFIMLTGARVGILNCSLSIIGVLWFNLRPWKFVLISLLALFVGFSIPVVIGMTWVKRVDSNKSQNFICKIVGNQKCQIDSEPELLNAALQYKDKGILKFINAVTRRIFIIPISVAGFYLEEAEISGTGIKNLSSKLIRDLSNDIGKNKMKKIYGKGSVAIPTVTAPTNFIILNFLYGGYLSILVSVFGIIILDLMFILINNSLSDLSIPFKAVCLYYNIIFIKSAYFTVLVTHGYMLFLFIFFCIFIIDTPVLSVKKSR